VEEESAAGFFGKGGKASIQIKRRVFSFLRFCRRRRRVRATHACLSPFPPLSRALLTLFNPSQLHFQHVHNVEATLCCKTNNSRLGQRSCSRLKKKKKKNASSVVDASETLTERLSHLKFPTPSSSSSSSSSFFYGPVLAVSSSCEDDDDASILEG
jgi:hypothetical protein